MALVSLTFDDGFLRHYDVAKALHRCGVSATFYVPTGRTPFFAENGGPLSTRPDLLGEMVDMGHEIGSHTHTHRNLTLLEPTDVRYELQKSKEGLDGLLGSRSRKYGLAYPFGEFNEVVVREVRRAFVYARAGSYSNRWNAVLDPFAVGSIGVSRHLAKIPLRAASHPSSPIVLMLHSEPLPLVLGIVRALKAMNVEIIPLRTSLGKLGVNVD
ncbi:MAG TPA: polysaccharide deacetylase family protein [Conexivisphaerales archaeon]|nr:polysaccharide deacetylase family protein [Conexivisphaerales archaeon]